MTIANKGEIIRNDTQHLVVKLTHDENIRALQCAQKIQHHLKVQISKGELKYQQNLEIIQQVISEHRERINAIAEPRRLSAAS